MNAVDVDVQHRDPELPSGWAKVRFGEIFELAYGKSLTKASRNTDGEFPVYGSNGIVGHHDTFLVEGPILIVGRKGAVGAVSFSSKPCWPIDTTYYVLESKHIDIRFSFFLLTSLRLNRFDRSTAIPGLNRDDAYNLVVDLPPLSEQQRIVTKVEELFSELDKGIESLKAARAKLDVYRQAVLKHAFEGKLTARWREENKDKLEPPDQLLARIQHEREARYEQQLKEWKAARGQEKGSGPKAPKSLPVLTTQELAALPELPEGWAWTRFGLLDIDLRRGPFGSSITKAMFVPSGFKVYEQGNAIYRDASRGNYFVTDTKYEELSGFTVSPGDFIVSCAGTVGRIFELPENSEAGVINQALMRVRINDRILNRHFFAKLFESAFFQRRILSDAKGTAMMNLAGIKELNMVPVAVCSPNEQKEIDELLEATLSEIDQCEQIVATSFQHTDAFRQSILKKAFSGKPVLQDPNDEPATVLVDRISAEKERTAKSKSSRKIRKKKPTA